MENTPQIPVELRIEQMKLAKEIVMHTQRVSTDSTILISVENFKSACCFLASFPSFFLDDARIALQKTTGNPLKNQLRIF